MMGGSTGMMGEVGCGGGATEEGVRRAGSRSPRPRRAEEDPRQARGERSTSHHPPPDISTHPLSPLDLCVWQQSNWRELAEPAGHTPTIHNRLV